MSPAGLEERAQDTARARAAAATIADRARVARHYHVPDAGVLRRSPRRRVHRRPPLAAPRWLRSGTSRRWLAISLVAIQVAILAALFVLPTFRASSIDIRGARLLSRAAILDAAGISSSQSIFSIDGDAVRGRLERLAWVRSAAVETDLPGTVRITVTEWSPIMRVHDASGDRIIAPVGASLPLSSVTEGSLPRLPLLVDERPVRQGTPPPVLEPALLRTLAAVSDAFPKTFGCAVARFNWRPDGRLAIVASTGWRAILGDVATDVKIEAIPAQIAALAALRGKIDPVPPTFGYVDLSNPAAPAVGGTPGAPEPAPVAASATPTPAPTSTPTATPRPTTTPTPSPTPLQINVGGTPKA
jgi:cell division septal protein FtsQ